MQGDTSSSQFPVMMSGIALKAIYANFCDEDDYRMDLHRFRNFAQCCTNLITDGFTVEMALESFCSVCGESVPADYNKFVEILLLIAAKRYPREDNRLDYQYANLLAYNVFRMENIDLSRSLTPPRNNRYLVDNAEPISYEIQPAAINDSPARQLQYSPMPSPTRDLATIVVQSPSPNVSNDGALPKFSPQPLPPAKTLVHKEAQTEQEASRIVPQMKQQKVFDSTPTVVSNRKPSLPWLLCTLPLLLLASLLMLHGAILYDNGLLSAPRTASCVADALHRHPGLHIHVDESGCLKAFGADLGCWIPPAWLSDPANSCRPATTLTETVETQVSEPQPNISPRTELPVFAEWQQPPALPCDVCGLQFVGT